MTVTAPRRTDIGNFDVWPLMFDALDCLCDALATTLGGSPCSCSIVGGMGPLPVDSCVCEGNHCGTAWVRLDAVFPSSTFNIPDASPLGSCSSPLSYRFHLGVVRCQPGPDDLGNPPTPDQLTHAANVTIEDMQASYRAALCCLTTSEHAPSAKNRLLGQWVPGAAPEGGCSGGYWPVTVWGVP